MLLHRCPKLKKYVARKYTLVFWRIKGDTIGIGCILSLLVPLKELTMATKISLVFYSCHQLELVKRYLLMVHTVKCFIS